MGNKPTNINAMLGLDMYLASLDSIECHRSKEQIKSFPMNFHPLMSWDIAGTAYWDLLENGRKTNDLRKLTVFAQEYNWSVDLPIILASSYQALVLTNVDQVICWVSPGFKAMTGYPANFAIGKTTGFLQGKNKSSVVEEGIKTQLNAGKTFTGSIINYRRNQEEYLCQLSIFPIQNKQNIITHFLTLEQEI
jgi:PAS domain S-box-containing protein